MDIFEAIFARQSIGKVRPHPVPRELIEKLLQAAAQAPNHYKVRPWRFTVLTGTARNRLGDLMAVSLLERIPECTEEAIKKERARPLRAPVVIAVAVDRFPEIKVPEIEHICAVAAAVENMLLSATALGLGAMWRTGSPAYDPNVKAFFGLEPDQHLIGFIYVGYPEVSDLPPKQRPGFEDRTVWVEE